MGYDLHQAATPRIDETTCTGCGRCAEVCPSMTLALDGGKIHIATRMFMGCIGCGQCAAVCPNGSVTVAGRRFEMGEMVDLPPMERRASPDQFDALLLDRRSVRKFEDKEIDRAILEQILAMTSTAPMGIPPSEVGIVVFHGREKVRQFTEDAVVAFRGMRTFLHPVTQALLRPFVGKANYEAMRDFVRPLIEHLIVCWERGEDMFAYGAPLALLFHHDPQADQADCHIATTYAMLAAQSLGLGSCMLGTCVGLGYAKPFKQKYGIPPQNNVGLGLVAGYPAVTFRRGIRRKLASVTFA